MTDGAYRLGSAQPVMIIEFSVTSWCNYTCAYCVTSVQQRREQSLHAFDHHDVAAWIAAFERVPFDYSLLVRGGEPFLDHASFSRFLAAVVPRTQYTRVDTNGSWSPERYAAVPSDVRVRAQLNVSFHPTQIELAPFAARIARITHAGWHVAMINYVMEAHQSAEYARVRDFFGERGIFVNPNPDAFDPQPQRKLLPMIDHVRKTGAPTLGKSCWFPSIAYFVAPDGVAERACGVPGRRLDFLRESDALEPLATPVRCPQRTCLCLDRYAFLDENPTRGRRLDLLAEYLDAVTSERTG